MKKSMILLIILFACVITSAQAQKIKLFGTKGVWELGGSIFYSNSTPVNNGVTNDPAGVLQIQPTAGYFIYKGIEIGVRPTINYTKTGGYSFTQMGLYIAPAYNFVLKGKIYPEVTALAGYTSESGTALTSAGGFSWGVEGGIKVNLLGNSLLFVGVQYRQDTYKISGTTSRTGYNIITVGAGWNVFF